MVVYQEVIRPLRMITLGSSLFIFLGGLRVQDSISFPFRSTTEQAVYGAEVTVMSLMVLCY